MEDNGQHNDVAALLFASTEQVAGLVPQAVCTFREREKCFAHARNQTHITHPVLQSLHYVIPSFFYSKILNYGTADMVVL